MCKGSDIFQCFQQDHMWSRALVSDLLGQNTTNGAVIPCQLISLLHFRSGGAGKDDSGSAPLLRHSSDSQQSCFCFINARITGVHYHTSLTLASMLRAKDSGSGNVIYIHCGIILLYSVNIVTC